MREKATPKGFTQNVVGSTGSRSVIWPATPSSKPYFPKIRKAAANLPFRYCRSLYLSLKTGGRGKGGITCALTCTAAELELAVSVPVADGGGMVFSWEENCKIFDVN